MAAPEPDALTLARVVLLAGGESRPALGAGVAQTVLQAHPRVDRYGLTPEDDGWEPTYNVFAAVAELWSIKAGMVAGDFNFKADSGDYSKGDVIAHCLAMEAKYAAMTAGSAPTAGDYPGDLGRIVVNG